MSHHHGQQENAPYAELNYGAGAKWIKNLTKDRLGTFHGGHYAGVNLSSILFTHRVDNSEHVKLKVLVTFSSSRRNVVNVIADGVHLR